MAERPRVPQFGNWEGDDVPYTVFFDKARRGRTGRRIINPNDPQENLDLVSDNEAPASDAPSRAARSDSEESARRGARKRAHEHVRSREDNDPKQFANSPARLDNVNHRAANVARQVYGGRGLGAGETQRRPARPSAGSDTSFDQSPLHPRARISGRGSGAPSPVREGKSSHDSSHGIPGRSRMKPRGNDSPDKGSAVPKFGEWNDSDPASADGYTHIFNKVREERQVGPVGVSSRPSESSHSSGHKQAPSDSSKVCCFPWCR